MMVAFNKNELFFELCLEDKGMCVTYCMCEVFLLR